MLSAEEYAHIKKNWSLLIDTKRDLTEQIAKHTQSLAEVKAKLASVKKEEAIYITRLAADIKEYELANKVEV